MSAFDGDDQLVDRLRAITERVDPVPEEVVLAGRSAIAHRDLDLRLAVLVEEELAGAGVRGDGDDWFTFEVGDVVVELALRHDDHTLRLLGHVDGGDVATVQVVQPHGAAPCAVDGLGRFAADVVAGPLRVEASLADGSTVATSWILASAP